MTGSRRSTPVRRGRYARPRRWSCSRKLLPLVRRFQGKVVDSNEAVAFEGLPNQVIPAIAPHLDIFHPNTGGIGLCGREVRKDGHCRLLPPVSCYLCPSFAALRTGPHQERLDPIQNFLRLQQNRSDRRILLQLEDVLLVQSKWAPSSPSNPSTTTRQKITLALRRGGPKGPPAVQGRKAVPTFRHTTNRPISPPTRTCLPMLARQELWR
jgi:hypothetical protein